MAWGKRIQSLKALVQAAKDRKAVSVGYPASTVFQRRPAAFMLQLSGEMLARYMEIGMYIYKPQKYPKHFAKNRIPF